MKQKKKKRLWALISALVFIVGLLPGEVVASASDANGADDTSDSFNTGTIEENGILDNLDIKNALTDVFRYSYNNQLNKARETGATEIRNLKLNRASADEGDLSQDGYHWDAGSRTLTLGDSAQFGSVILPDNHAVTVVTNGENRFNSLSVEGEGFYGQSYKMDITISGNGTLTVQEGIYTGMDGDALTVDYGAGLVVNGGISIGASGGVNSTVTVKGRLSANGDSANAICAGKVVVKNTGELHVSGTYGVVLNGMVVNDNKQYDGVFTIENGGAFYADCSVYAVCVFTHYIAEELSNKDAEKMIVLPNLYLPSGYEIKAVKGSQEESGTSYGITIAEEDAETKFEEGELIGAAGSIRLLSHNHKLTHIAAEPKTCTENGHTEYWTCNGCGRIYSDETGTTQIRQSETVIPAGHELQYHSARAATCTEGGNIEYWFCSVCAKYFADEAATNEIAKEKAIIDALGHDFSGAYDEYDETGHWHICHRQGCRIKEPHIAHNFTDYVYNDDATYFADGTETAVCDANGCPQTHTRAKTGTMLHDDTAPTGEIRVNENSFKAFLNTITFGIFCKDKYDVTITGKDDETNIKSIEYYISETAISEEDIVQVTEWKKYSAFSIADDGKYIIYAKITNNVGNVTYISTNGMVLDETLPIIKGLMNGKTYCSEVTFTVEDENIDYVTVNGKKTTDYTLKADGSTYEVKAVDMAGNESLPCKVTVRNGHTFTTYVSNGDATCMADGTESAKCDFCDVIDTRTAIGSKQNHSMTHHTAKAATCTEDGNIEYWTCSFCGKYFSDEAGANVITAEDIVVNALGHDFSGAYDAYDENGHWHICHHKGCDVNEAHVAHNFTDYVYNNDATYFADGTETATCDADGCSQTHTRVKTGTMLHDDTAPTGEIKVKENSFKAFLNAITFDTFYKDKYDVTITGKDDETDIKSIEYYISETAISEEDIVQITEWKKYSAFSITDDGKYIIYAKITNNVGNVTYISTNGMVLDETLPVLVGLTDGKTYCSEVTFTVADENINYVTVNGEKTTDYTLKADGSTYEVKAVDMAGNESLPCKVTVRNGHTFTTYVSNNDATCTMDGTETAKCDFCDALDTRTAIDSNTGHSITHHTTKAATCTEDGNIEYWTCSSCKKYFADEAGANVIAKEDTIIEATGHEIRIENKREATCTKEGYTGDQVCIICGEIIQKGTVIAKLDHNFRNGSCTVCGLTDPDLKTSAKLINPKTGDSNNFIIWSVLLLLSVIGIVSLRMSACNKQRKR